MSEGFLTDVDTMIFFFRVCRRYGIDNKADRIVLLRKLVKRNKVKYLRDARDYIKGKNVIEVRRKENP